jgi:hypothetical protein
MKIKKPFPVFYWPWAEFNPANPAWPPIPLLHVARVVANEAQQRPAQA